MKTIYLGGGCFWCTEAVYQNLQGVIEVIPGYMGGSVPNPSYEAVCSGATGHAEVAKIVYDETAIDTKDILDVFFFTHDPTTANRQGNDVGTQYRSIIFYADEDQREIAKQAIEEAKAKLPTGKEVVTEVVSAAEFYPAENYHHNYYMTHRDAPYCMLIIEPKVQKLQERYKDKVRPAGEK